MCMWYIQNNNNNTYMAHFLPMNHVMSPMEFPTPGARNTNPGRPQYPKEGAVACWGALFLPRPQCIRSKRLLGRPHTFSGPSRTSISNTAVALALVSLRCPSPSSSRVPISACSLCSHHLFLIALLIVSCRLRRVPRGDCCFVLLHGVSRRLARRAAAWRAGGN